MSSNKPLEPNKTLVGIPGDFQAAVDKLRAQQGAESGEDIHRTRMGNAHQSGASTAPPPLPSSRPFQPPSGFQPAPPPAPMHHAPPRMQPAERTLLGMPNNLQAVLRAADAAVAQRAAAPREPYTEPHGSAAAPPAKARPEPRVHLHLDGSDGDAPGRAADHDMYSTRMAPSELDALPGSGNANANARVNEDEDEDATDVVRRPRLALSERTTHRTTHSSRKLWPVLAAVLGVAVLFGGGWLAARLLHQPQDSAAAPVPVVVKVPEGVPSATVTDVSAATQPERVAKPVAAVPPSATNSAIPTQPAQATQPILSGSPPELERQAIDFLIAKNYPAAAQAYERLRAAEPDNKAYAVMLGLLSRSESKSCGQPGQEPCASR